MIYDYLLKYGFKPNNIGLNYLADIINLGIKGENLEPLSRVGYKLIADKYKKNIATIEKDIQNSISNAWLYGNSDLLYQTFGSTISDVKGKPTNKHFIYTMIEKIRYEFYWLIFKISLHNWGWCDFLFY